MSKRQAVCLLIVVALLLSAAVWWRSTDAQPEPIPEPERDWNGIKTVKVYDVYYTPEDAEAIARTVWGEAGGCPREEQAQVVWCILNRVDDSRFPDSILGVITSPSQFHGYSASFPVTPEIMAVTMDVLYRWNMEKNGETVTRELGSDYLWFTGDSIKNHFRTTY